MTGELVSSSSGKCPLANTIQYSRYTRFPANIHFYCVKKAPKGRAMDFLFHLGMAIEERVMLTPIRQVAQRRSPIVPTYMKRFLPRFRSWSRVFENAD